MLKVVKFRKWKRIFGKSSHIILLNCTIFIKQFIYFLRTEVLTWWNCKEYEISSHFRFQFSDFLSWYQQIILGGEGVFLCKSSTTRGVVKRSRPFVCWEPQLSTWGCQIGNSKSRLFVDDKNYQLSGGKAGSERIANCVKRESTISILLLLSPPPKYPQTNSI